MREALENLLKSRKIALTYSDPDEPDMPLLGANDAFYELTGYAPSHVLGRNCRFLQGPETDPRSIEVLSTALATRDSVAICLRNYKKSGAGFDNFLRITPVTLLDGKTYFLASQAEIHTYDWPSQVERECAMFTNAATSIPNLDDRNKSKIDRLYFSHKSILAAVRSYYALRQSEQLMNSQMPV